MRLRLRLSFWVLHADTPFLLSLQNCGILDFVSLPDGRVVAISDVHELILCTYRITDTFEKINAQPRIDGLPMETLHAARAECIAIHRVPCAASLVDCRLVVPSMIMRAHKRSLVGWQCLDSTSVDAPFSLCVCVSLSLCL